MPRKFDETVQKVAERISRGHTVLTERVRQGRRRSISVGPYRTAVQSREKFAFCTLPALPGHDDCQTNPSPKRMARAFVRLVGVDNARDALVRESRKRQG